MLEFAIALFKSFVDLTTLYLSLSTILDLCFCVTSLDLSIKIFILKIESEIAYGSTGFLTMPVLLIAKPWLSTSIIMGWLSL